MVDIASMTHEAKPKITHRAMFSDGREHDFCLSSVEIIEELERLCRCGIGEIALRLGSLRFKEVDVRETIRLGLIGAGTPFYDAAALVMGYVDPAPLDQHLQLAAEIIGARVWGKDRAGNGPAAAKVGDEGAPQ